MFKYKSLHIFLNCGIKLDTAILISFATLTFAQYLLFSQISSKTQLGTNTMSKMKLKSAELYHLEEDINFLLSIQLKILSIPGC